MRTLRELEAKFMRWEQRDPDPEDRALNPQWPADYKQDFFVPVNSFAEAHMIKFLCPKSFKKNGGPRGCHSVYVVFEGSPVPPNLFKNDNGETVRWKASGTSLDDLSLMPSILEIDPDCGWHGYVGSCGILPGHAG